MTEQKSKYLPSPWLIREALQRPDALVAAGNVILTEHKENTALAGVLLNPAVRFPDTGTWEKHAGVFVFLPHYSYVARESVSGWKLSDILTEGGLDHQHWKEMPDG